MSLPNRNNPYSFQAWLQERNVNFFTYDTFLQQAIDCYVDGDTSKLKTILADYAEAISFRWNYMAQECAKVENRPYLKHYDAYHNRIDRVVLPQAMLDMEREVFQSGLFKNETGDWERFIKMMLLHENGESGVGCPTVCTEGLIRVIEELSDPASRSPELSRILLHCTEGIDGDFAIGAQFLSEIQGGSDVPANLVEAVKDGDKWRIFGTKFFCSAIQADYFAVTAKASNMKKVGLFIVPAWLEDNKKKEIRNGYTIDNLKWKMGTVELPTAELTFNGAVGYQIGELDRGVANVVGIVLSYSRLTVGATSSGLAIRAVRDAQIYAEFREAFGQKINSFPLLRYQLDEMEKTVQGLIAGAFKLFVFFLQMGGRFTTKKRKGESLESRKARFLVRQLLLLAKMYTAKISTAVIHDAMSVFGGHGVMEDFSVLPRLFRDQNINELWEGPRNVLLAQMFRDFQKNADWYDPKEFVRICLDGADKSTVEYFVKEITAILAHPNLNELDEGTLKIAKAWDKFADDFMRAFQMQCREEVLAGNK